MITNQDLISTARGWINTPIREVGFDRTGCNCVGLWAGVSRDVGLTQLFEIFEPYAYIPFSVGKYGFLRLIQKHLIACDRKKLIPGMLLVTKELDRPCHVAGYTGHGNIIETGKTKVSEHQLSPMRNVVQAFKVPGVDYGA